jgi:hypothetical protein
MWPFKLYRAELADDLEDESCTDSDHGTDLPHALCAALSAAVTEANGWLVPHYRAVPAALGLFDQYPHHCHILMQRDVPLLEHCVATMVAFWVRHGADGGYAASARVVESGALGWAIRLLSHLMAVRSVPPGTSALISDIASGMSRVDGLDVLSQILHTWRSDAEMDAAHGLRGWLHIVLHASVFHGTAADLSALATSLGRVLCPAARAGTHRGAAVVPQAAAAYLREGLILALAWARVRAAPVEAVERHFPTLRAAALKVEHTIRAAAALSWGSRVALVLGRFTPSLCRWTGVTDCQPDGGLGRLLARVYECESMVESICIC